MGGPSQTTTKQENTDPWVGQQPYLLDAFERSKKLLNSQEGTQPYAGMTPEQLRNFQQMVGFAQGQGGSGDALNFTQNARDSAMGQAARLDGAAGGFAGQGSSLVDQGTGMIGQGGNAMQAALGRLQGYSPTGGVGSNISEAGAYADNPFISGQVDAAMRDSVRAATEHALPGIARSAAATGNIGSSKRGLAEGVVTRGLNDQAADVSAGLRGQAYSQGLNLAEQGRQFNNNAMLDAFKSAGALGGQQAGAGVGTVGAGVGAGGLGLNFNQAALDARKFGGDLNSSYFGQRSGLFDLANQGGTGLQQGNQIDLNNVLQAPWDRLANYYGVVGSNNWGKQTTGTETTKGSPGGLSTAGGIIGGLGSLFKLFPFSDRRLKSDIRKVGTLDNGLTVYGYRIGSGPYQIGVMADEVQGRDPSAVHTDERGWMHVDYERATA